MQATLKIALIIIMVMYLFIIAKAVKRKNMRISYLIFWIIIGIGLIIALLIPNFINSISKSKQVQITFFFLFEAISLEYILRRGIIRSKGRKNFIILKYY